MYALEMTLLGHLQNKAIFLRNGIVVGFRAGALLSHPLPARSLVSGKPCSL